MRALRPRAASRGSWLDRAGDDSAAGFRGLAVDRESRFFLVFQGEQTNVSRNTEGCI